MSNYKLIEVAKKSSGQEAQSIYNHTDLTTALAAMNNDFGVQVKDEDVVKVYCLLIDNENGAKIDKCCYPAPRPDMDLVVPEEGEEPAPDTTIRFRVYTHNDYADDNISPYESERIATGNFHTKKAAAMNKAECNHAITILLDGNGDFKEFSNWERPV